MIIEGNEMEGIGGPAIIIFGITNTITIKSNVSTVKESPLVGLFREMACGYGRVYC